MASFQQRLPANVAGDFFVDATCIDCETCRWLAPATFAESQGQSSVYRQPETESQRHRALMAVLACPVAAIGTQQKHAYAAAQAAFPDPIAGEVYHCGYHSPKSYGAASYFIRHPSGNLLIDSPRFTTPLVRRLEALGGVRWLFLTHADDVADHHRFQRHFGCQRILHQADVTAETQTVEIQPMGDAVVVLDEAMQLIPVPGHTPGSMCPLYRETFLFSGDHLWWDPVCQRLSASRAYCWYDWEQQTASVERLLAHRFEWLLPGHGRRCQLPPEAMAMVLRQCAAWMKRHPAVS
jgi:glyoxylase-like metal-dependent hydrolase (beta-lactamase superfamily II)/ferredoxin